MVLVMIGELADKSQLLALVLATRYRVWQVLLGILLATFVVHFFSAAVGQAIGGWLPSWLLPWVSGVLFIGFGLWTLRGDTLDEEGSAETAAGRFGPLAAVAGAFFLAELGDKTQIMTMTIAADPGAAVASYVADIAPGFADVLARLGAGPEASKSMVFWGVTLGSTVGMVIADALAILVGHTLGKHLPERKLALFSGSIFIIFGLLTIVGQYLWRR
ncbi:MAG: TMEM165/GDT1 family protein [Coriobacteriales bacterium]|nr:TMEM165/GDT1 family protein [Coriobacteriales bacterium]